MLHFVWEKMVEISMESVRMHQNNSCFELCIYLETFWNEDKVYEERDNIRN